jgi:hypothetical protein
MLENPFTLPRNAEANASLTESIGEQKKKKARIFALFSMSLHCTKSPIYVFPEMKLCL